MAETAARIAVDLAPRDAEARFSLAASHSLGWDWPGAKSEFPRALELDPHSPDVHHGYAILYLAPLGRLDEAEAEIRTAVDLDRSCLNDRVVLGKSCTFNASTTAHRLNCGKS